MKEIRQKILIGLCTAVLLNSPVLAMNKKAYKHFLKANNFYSTYDYDNAEIEYKAAEELAPNELVIDLKLAGLYTDQQDWDNALIYYKKALAINQKDGSIYLSIGSILRAKKDYSGAYDAYKKAAELLPNYRFIHLNMAQVQELENNQKESLDEYKKFISAYPNNLEARKSIAELYLNLDMDDAAVKEYDFIYQKAPNDFTEWANYARALTLTENFQKVPEIIQHAITIEPDNAQYKVILATAYENLDEKEKAIDEYKLALSQDKTLTDVLANIAKLSEDLGKDDDAIKYYEQCLEAQPDNSDVYYKLAAIYQKNQDFTNSISTLNKLKEHEKDDVVVLREIGKNYYM